MRYGFSRGLGPVAYVKHILDRYGHCREIVVNDLQGTEEVDL